MRAVILAGGLGLRLRPLTNDVPKPLLKVAGRPIIEYQLDWLAQSGLVEEAILACGYRWEKLREHLGAEYRGLRISYAVERELLGTGGAIRNALLLAKPDDEEKLIAMNGDVITDLPLKKMVEAYEAMPTIAQMLLVPYRSPFGIVRIDKLRMVRKFEEKPAFPDVWVNGGIYILHAKRLMPYLPERGDIERSSFPVLTEYGELSAYPYYGYWASIDSIKSLEEVEAYLSRGEAARA
jgi:glucose-1-phosphate thymidylyltransferase